ncbi:hypothetical protein ALP93_101776 [Pseudomonas syringae pv. helianthi]|nr:hypothetical protein ALP93_101776 [Pseudomonas syringae pv. helianthi]
MAPGVGWLRRNRASVILTSGGADVGILALAVQDLQGRKDLKGAYSREAIACYTKKNLFPAIICNSSRNPSNPPKLQIAQVVAG